MIRLIQTTNNLEDIPQDIRDGNQIWGEADNLQEFLDTSGYKDYLPHGYSLYPVIYKLEVDANDFFPASYILYLYK